MANTRDYEITNGTYTEGEWDGIRAVLVLEKKFPLTLRRLIRIDVDLMKVRNKK